MWRTVIAKAGMASGVARLRDERGGVFAGSGIVFPHLVLQNSTDAGIVDMTTAEQAPGTVRVGTDQTNGRMPFVLGFVVDFPGRVSGVTHGRAILEIGSADGTPTLGSALYHNDVEHRRFGRPIP